MMADELVVVFENAPGPEPARFIEVENATTGESVVVKWSKWDYDPERWALGSFVAWEDARRLEELLARYREALELIAHGVWTARNSVESIVWTAREALKSGGRDGRTVPGLRHASRTG